MRVTSRLRKLEASVPALARAHRDLTDEYILYMFEALGHHGQFDQEPDFPKALAFYRQALHDAQKQTDPPFDPPADFMPHVSRHARETDWRSEARFPAVRAGWWWLMEMWVRARDGVPPVTEEEFADLAAWLEAHKDRLTSTSVSTIRYGLRTGARARRSGEIAEEIRRLRAQFNAAQIKQATQQGNAE